METKNISRQDTQIKEYLERGYAELEKGKWEFAKISFDKVISLEETCGKAYIGRALAMIRLKSLDDAMTLGYIGKLCGILVSDSEKCYWICADEGLRLELCGYIYKEAYRMFEFHRDAEKAIHLFETIENDFGGYKKSKENIKLCNDYLDLERKIGDIVKDSSYDRVIEQRTIKSIERTNRELYKLEKGLKCSLVFTIILSLIVFIPLYLNIDLSAIYFISMISAVILCGILTIMNKNDLKKKKYSIASWKSELRKMESQKEVLIYKIQTMLGDDIEMFEYEAEALGFMVGYGKALIEKYTTI